MCSDQRSLSRRPQRFPPRSATVLVQPAQHFQLRQKTPPGSPEYRSPYPLKPRRKPTPSGPALRTKPRACLCRLGRLHSHSSYKITKSSLLTILSASPDIHWKVLVLFPRIHISCRNFPWGFSLPEQWYPCPTGPLKPRPCPHRPVLAVPTRCHSLRISPSLEVRSTFR